jgi:hypothetical protein
MTTTADPATIPPPTVGHPGEAAMSSDPSSISDPSPIEPPRARLTVTLQHYIGRIFRYRLTVTGRNETYLVGGWYDSAGEAMAAGRQFARDNGYRVRQS